jgi:hypothetical protein
VELFLGFYAFLEGNLLRIIEESKQSRKILGACLNIKNFEYYRPVYLCNIVYKIISKISANMIKSIMSCVVSEEEFGFLFNRQIHNAVGIAQE